MFKSLGLSINYSSSFAPIIANICSIFEDLEPKVEIFRVEKVDFIRFGNF